VKLIFRLYNIIDIRLNLEGRFRVYCGLGRKFSGPGRALLEEALNFLGFFASFLG